MKKDSISICFCAWNEENNIVACIDDALKYVQNKFPEAYEIYVIDNASTDRTPAIVRELSIKNPRIKLHRHEENRLYSGSYRSALAVSQATFLAVLDGDYQHTCNDIDKALDLIQNHDADLVYAWKKERHDGIVRSIFSFGLKTVSQFLIGHRLHDINAGFRVFKKDRVSGIQIVEKVNSVGPELYCEARRLNLKVGEIVVQHFARTDSGGIHASLMPLLRATKRFTGYLLNLRKRYGSTPVLPVSHA